MREPINEFALLRVQCTVALLRVANDGTDGHVVSWPLVIIQIQSFRHFVCTARAVRARSVLAASTNASLRLSIASAFVLMFVPPPAALA